jgi:hypothetical protein
MRRSDRIRKSRAHRIEQPRRASRRTPERFGCGESAVASVDLDQLSEALNRLRGTPRVSTTAEAKLEDTSRLPMSDMGFDGRQS